VGRDGKEGTHVRRHYVTWGERSALEFRVRNENEFRGVRGKVRKWLKWGAERAGINLNDFLKTPGAGVTSKGIVNFVWGKFVYTEKRHCGRYCPLRQNAGGDEEGSWAGKKNLVVTN